MITNLRMDLFEALLSTVHHSYLIVQHEGTATVALARVAAAVSVARAEEDLGDGLEVGLVAVLVGPHQDGHAAQDVNLKYFLCKMKYFPRQLVCADLVTVVVGGAPAQRHGQGVGEGLLGVAAGGQTQGLDIPGHITAVTRWPGAGTSLLGEGDRPLEGEHRNVVVEPVGSEVGVGHDSLHL